MPVADDVVLEGFALSFYCCFDGRKPMDSRWGLSPCDCGERDVQLSVVFYNYNALYVLLFFSDLTSLIKLT